MSASERLMATAAAKRYWDSLPDECVCGAPSEQIHHILHVNRQRITKDDMLVVKLCVGCHQHNSVSVHRLGGERQFLEATGWDLVHLAVLRRHNFEVRG
jgi:hypothetical protein